MLVLYEVNVSEGFDYRVLNEIFVCYKKIAKKYITFWQFYVL